ncbi:hypothetical protein L6452_19000 [Arctium lappa]|uniref:Uncharacterized protein n=1 Tax=Arctium lappa TaxID=4217 RepID=A0ACB9B6Q2_ARCLA|nr:hypothetical protein L6452_19000 [Arctium lappa]
MVPISSLQESKTPQSSGAEDPSVFKSRRPLGLQEPKTPRSSGAEDLSIFSSRRFLNLQEPKISQSSKHEDFSQTYCTFLTKSTLQAKTPQDKRYILYLVEDMCPSFAQQVSHAFNA